MQRRKSGCYRRNCGDDTQLWLVLTDELCFILGDAWRRRDNAHLRLAAGTMPLPLSANRRALKHTRAITIEAFARDDGLWDLDARITDHKTRDIQLASGMRPQGSPLHELSLRVTIDSNMNVVDAAASSDAVPYPGFCEEIGPDYKKLVGLNLLRQFRQGVKDQMGGTSGCTHLTELAQILPTAAVQAFAGDVIATRDGADQDGQEKQPFQLDRCHALRLDGPAVVKFYPRWAKTPAANSSS